MEKFGLFLPILYSNLPILTLDVFVPTSCISIFLLSCVSLFLYLFIPSLPPLKVSPPLPLLYAMAICTYINVYIWQQYAAMGVLCKFLHKVCLFVKCKYIWLVEYIRNMANLHSLKHYSLCLLFVLFFL